MSKNGLRMDRCIPNTTHALDNPPPTHTHKPTRGRRAAAHVRHHQRLVEGEEAVVQDVEKRQRAGEVGGGEVLGFLGLGVG